MLLFLSNTTIRSCKELAPFLILVLLSEYLLAGNARDRLDDLELILKVIDFVEFMLEIITIELTSRNEVL